MVHRASAAWPDVRIEATAFLAKAALSVREEADPLSALENLHVEELYLATACASGDRAALAIFHETWLPVVEIAVASVARAAERDEVCQRVLVRLFAAHPPEEPHIARYRGKGRLKRWLRVVAMREAYSHARKLVPSPIDDEALLAERVLARDDPEVAVLKQRYRSELKEALQNALSELSVRQRNLLRHELLDGLNGEQIGAMYGVQRSTVAKWRKQSRAKLIASMQEFLEHRLGLGADEMLSMARLLESQLDLSLVRLLEQREP